MVTLRAARDDEADAITRVIDGAFAGQPHSDGSEARIVRALRAAGALVHPRVAVADGAIVGFNAFSPVTVDGAHDGWFGLGPLAVAGSHRRRGIGAALVEEGLERLERDGARGVVLVGDPSYYGRFGFRADARLVCPGLPAAYFQALAFGAGMPRGVVAYAPAFGVG